MLGDSEQDSVAELKSAAQAAYGKLKKENQIIAFTLALSANSNAAIPEVKRLDLIYAIPNLEEALTIPQCANLPSVIEAKKALKAAQDLGNTMEANRLLHGKMIGNHSSAAPCRRSSETVVNRDGGLDPKGQTVAQWNESLILDRLAAAAALLADSWATLYLQSGHPHLCRTWRYAVRPAFISPLDPTCFGYALNEKKEDFRVREFGAKGPGRVSWLFAKKTPSRDRCLSYDLESTAGFKGFSNEGSGSRERTRLFPKSSPL